MGETPTSARYYIWVLEERAVERRAGQSTAQALLGRRSSTLGVVCTSDISRPMTIVQLSHTTLISVRVSMRRVGDGEAECSARRMRVDLLPPFLRSAGARTRWRFGWRSARMSDRSSWVGVRMLSASVALLPCGACQ